MIVSVVRQTAAAGRGGKRSITAAIVAAAQPHIPRHGFTVAAIKAALQSPTPSHELEAVPTASLNDWNLHKLFPGGATASTGIPTRLFRHWDQAQLSQCIHSPAALQFSHATEISAEATALAKLAQRLESSEAVRDHLLLPFSYISATSVPIGVRAFLPRALSLLPISLPDSIPNPLPLASRAAHIADEICSASSVDSDFGPSWYATRARLATAYLAAELHLLASSSSLPASLDVLQRVAGLDLGSSSAAKAASPSSRSSAHATRPWPTTAVQFRRTIHTAARASFARPQALHPQGPASTRPRRYNSTLPNQQQVVENFANPFRQFLMIISRVARLIVAYILVLGAAAFVMFEGTHMYVEYVAMRRDAKAGRDPDSWGWDDQAQDEMWSRTAGTDPRLGLSGRHALRSAWICLNWGGGIDPELIFGGPGAPGASGANVARYSTPSINVIPAHSDGLNMASRFLAVAVEIAEKKGIRLPDVGAVAAGLASPQEARTDAPLDRTALALEWRLAAAREMLGTPTSVPLAIAGYERIFDALNVEHQKALSKSDGQIDGTGAASVTRLIRLATKLGDLKAFGGQRQEAEQWLTKAISLAGVSSTDIAAGTAAQDTSNSSSSSNDGESTPQSAAKRGSWLPAWLVGGHKTNTSGAGFSYDESAPVGETAIALAAHVGEKLETDSTLAPTPALTRALVAALLSLSGFYAATPNPDVSNFSNATWRGGLQKALQAQSLVGRLSSIELDRLAAARTAAANSGQTSRLSGLNSTAAQLHRLWLQHYSAVAIIHSAETLYALEQGRGGSIASAVEGATELLKGAISRLAGGIADASKDALAMPGASAEQPRGKLVPNERSLWLLSCAHLLDSDVFTTLASTRSIAGAKQAGDKTKSEATLKEQWQHGTGAGQRKIASILLRDSAKVKEEVKAMTVVLTAKQQGRGKKQK